LHGLYLPPAEIARVDTGVRQGDAVTPFYDPMIAKIIASGEDRPAALARLRRALAETAVLGVATNLSLLGQIVAHPEFAAGAVDTGFIERHRDAVIPPRRPAPDAALAAAALSRLLARAAAAEAAAARCGDKFSPWARIDGWQLNGRGRQEIIFRDGAEERTVTATARAKDWVLEIEARAILAAGESRADGLLTVMLDGVRRHIRVLEFDFETAVFIDGDSWRLFEIDPLAAHSEGDAGAGRLTAPMPGRITQLMAEPGTSVQRGQPLMIIEAMKMEHTVAAPADGVVEAVRFAVGDQVEEGTELIAFAAAERPEQA
jgi:3-methylcrotonyl-CoA carboxylase alpha subunit